MAKNRAYNAEAPLITVHLQLSSTMTHDVSVVSQRGVTLCNGAGSQQDEENAADQDGTERKEGQG